MLLARGERPLLLPPLPVAASLLLSPPQLLRLPLPFVLSKLVRL